jgi:putative toxin-antitoxin system antitoxin component (TIGR02293 family)
MGCTLPLVYTRGSVDACGEMLEYQLIPLRSYNDTVIEPQNIGRVLGGPRAVGPITSLLQLSAAVERGLPKSTLRTVASHVYSEAAEQRDLMYRVVPEATFKRRKSRLSRAESERTERLARVVAMAEYVWDDRGQARRFLLKPHPELGGKAPIEAARTELGARQAEEVMARIVYGLPA